MSSLDNYVGVALHLASTVIISRLLTPAEVGIFAIAAAIQALAGTVRDFGIGEYLIQERDLTRDKVRAAFGLNLAVSWLMAATLVAIGPAVAGFYREQGLHDVLAVLALGFIIAPFGAVLQAWFRRELDYAPIVTSNICANAGALIVAVSMAWAGFGYMSLAWSSFAGIALTVLVTVWFRPTNFPWWPGVRGISQPFHFGRMASTIYIAAQLAKGAPGLIIGRATGFADVGLFSRGNGLVEMFNRLIMQPVLQVCMPYFAQSQRLSGTMSSAYMRSASMLTAVGWPVLSVLAAAAYPAVHVVYGSQWLHAVSLAQVLCVAAIIELPFTLSREALLAKGEARRANVLQLQIVALQILGLTAVIPFGPIGACWGLAAAAVGAAGLSFWHLRRGIGLQLLPLALACRPSAVLTCLAVAPILCLEFVAPAHEGNYVRWAIAAAGCATTTWLLALRWLRHDLWHELSSALPSFVGRVRPSN